MITKARRGVQRGDQHVCGAGHTGNVDAQVGQALRLLHSPLRHGACAARYLVYFGHPRVQAARLPIAHEARGQPRRVAAGRDLVRARHRGALPFWVLLLVLPLCLFVLPRCLLVQLLCASCILPVVLL